MKKILSLIIAALMLLSCAALAEADDTLKNETKSISLFASENISNVLPSIDGTRPDMRSSNFAPPSTTDSVTINGSTVIVKTAEDVLFMANVPANYTCVSQDYEASIFSLMRFTDPEGLINELIADSCHLLFINDLNDNWYKVITAGTDAVASMIKDINTLSESRVLEYAKAFSANNNVQFNDIINAGSYTWMRFNDQIFVTVVNGQYIFVIWLGDEGEEFTENSLLDATELLQGLTIFA